MKRLGSAMVLILAVAWTAGAQELVNSVPAEHRPIAEQLEPFYKQRPNDAGVLYQVAALYARAGMKTECLRVLKQMVDTGAGLHPRARDGFASLVEDPDFKALIERIRKENPPVLDAEVGFQVAEADLVPEGIAWSASQQRFYLGSVKKKIVAVDKQGSAAEFVGPERDGLGVVLGLRVDDQRGELWAASAGAKESRSVNGLFRFRMSDGKLLGKYEIPLAQADLLNDVAVTPDGVAYLTSTNDGSLYRIGRNGEKPEQFLPPNSLPDPNGVTASPDGKYLFVAGWYTVVRVNLATKEVKVVENAPNISDACIDGLYFYGERDLIGIQNCVHDGPRVLRFRLNDALDRIEKMTVLSSYEPEFSGVTTGAIAGDEFYFMANNQFRKLGPGFKPQVGVKFDPLKVMRVKLK